MNFVWFIGLFVILFLYKKILASFCICNVIVCRFQRIWYNKANHFEEGAEHSAQCTRTISTPLRRKSGCILYGTVSAFNEKAAGKDLRHRAVSHGRPRPNHLYRSFESKDDVLDYYLDRQMTLLAGQLPAYSTLEKT